MPRVRVHSLGSCPKCGGDLVTDAAEPEAKWICLQCGKRGYEMVVNNDVVTYTATKDDVIAYLDAISDEMDALFPTEVCTPVVNRMLVKIRRVMAQEAMKLRFN